MSVMLTPCLDFPSIVVSAAKPRVAGADGDSDEASEGTSHSDIYHHFRIWAVALTTILILKRVLELVLFLNRGRGKQKRRRRMKMTLLRDTTTSWA